MSLVGKIKSLCDSKDMTLASLERKLNFSNGSMRRWDESSPASDKLKKVAEFFNVSTDYLLGNTEHKNIDEELKAKMLNQKDLTVYDLAAHSIGHDEKLSDEERERIKIAIKIALAKNGK